MVLFLFSFKDITDTHGKSHHNSKKDGRLPAPVAKKNSYLLTLSMMYEQAIRRSLAFIFSVHSCSSLSHSSRQSCLGRDSFTELTQCFLHRGVSVRWRCVFRWNLVTVLLQIQHTFPQEINASKHSVSNTALPIRCFYCYCLLFMMH